MLFPGTTQEVTEEDKADAIPTERVLDSINPITYFTTAKKINQWQPQLLIERFWMPFFAPSLGTVNLLVRKKGRIIIGILDNVIPHERRPGDLPLIKYYLNRCHGFVVMSEITKNDMLRLKPDAKYIFHPHPIYDHFGKKFTQQVAQKKLGIPANKKVLLFFGFIRKYKGLDLLLQSLAQLPQDYHLLIAGEVYGDWAYYQEIIDQFGLQNRITKMVRYINDDDVPEIFSASDVCVLPYKSATQSGIMNISYHFELPVLVTRVGGLAESVEKYNTGLVIPTPDVDEITTYIKRFFSDFAKDNFSENIREFKRRYSWKNLTKAIEKFYEELKR